MSIQWANTAFNRTILANRNWTKPNEQSSQGMKTGGSSSSCNTIPDLSHQTITSFMEQWQSGANNHGLIGQLMGILWGYYGDIPFYPGLSDVICESLWGNWPLPNRTPSKMSAEFLSPQRSDPMRFGRDAHQCHQLSSSEDAIAVSFTLSLVLYMFLQLGLQYLFFFFFS